MNDFELLTLFGEHGALNKTASSPCFILFIINYLCLCLTILGKQKLCSLMQSCAKYLDDSGVFEGSVSSFFTGCFLKCEVAACQEFGSDSGLDTVQVQFGFCFPPCPLASTGPGLTVQEGLVVMGGRALCVCASWS